MLENYAKIGNEDLSLEQRVADAIERKDLGYRLYHDLFVARRDDLTWNTFYSLLEIPSEKENGYWLSAKVASTLLGPVISKQFYKNQNARVSERVEDDFLSEVIMEIARVIPNYSREKSEFPNYIKLYIKQCGYVHNKDYSVYLQKKKNIRVFSQNNLAEESSRKEGSNSSSPDGYAQVASAVTIEEEIDRKEKYRKSTIFYNVVVQKAFSDENEKRNYAEAEKIRLKQDKIRLLRMSDEDDNNKERTTENKVKILALEEDVNTSKSKNVLNKDMQNTIVNACIWKKFLGGVESYEDKFFEKIAEAIESKEV